MRVLLGTVAVLLLISLPLAPLGFAQEGQVPYDQAPEVTIDVYIGGGDETTFDIYPKEIIVQPGARVTFHVVNVQATEHDLTFLSMEGLNASSEDIMPREDNDEDAIKTPVLQAGEEYNLTVTIDPEFQGSITYICSVPGHRDLGMEGSLVVGAAAEEAEVTDFGVDYLAYWVGIVSFFIVFVVLVGTFFFFRYGETKEAVDHRTGASITAAASGADLEGEMTPTEGEEGFLPEPSKVAILLSVVAIVLWALTEFTSIFGGA